MPFFSSMPGLHARQETKDGQEHDEGLHFCEGERLWCLLLNESMVDEAKAGESPKGFTTSDGEARQRQYGGREKIKLAGGCELNVRTLQPGSDIQSQ